MSEDVQQFEWQQSGGNWYYLVAYGKRTQQIFSLGMLASAPDAELQEIAKNAIETSKDFAPATVDELYAFLKQTADEHRKASPGVQQRDTWDGHFKVGAALLKSPYYAHAIKEFDKTFPLDKMDAESYDMQQAILQNVIEMMETFEKQGHSGFSMSYMLNVFNKVIYFKPIKDEEK